MTLFVEVTTAVVVAEVVFAVAVILAVELVQADALALAALHCAFACKAYCMTGGSFVTGSGYRRMLMRARGIRPSVARTSVSDRPGATTCEQTVATSIRSILPGPSCVKASSVKAYIRG